MNYDGEFRYSFPIGAENDDALICRIIAELRAANHPLTLAGLSKTQLEIIERLFAGQIEQETQSDLFDYLYDAEKLASLAGKKLHAKRNFVNRFIANNPDYVFEPLSPENIEECLMTYGLWLFDKDDGFDTIPGESKAVERALFHFSELELDGGLLRLSKGGNLAAFAIGELLSELTYVVHFEKALRDAEGAYQMVNREFVRSILAPYPTVRYINREDDMGNENLRKAKRSYYPDIMEEKYSVKFTV